MQATDPPQHLHVSLVGSPASLDRQSRLECYVKWTYGNPEFQRSEFSNIFNDDLNWHTSIFCFWFEKNVKKSGLFIMTTWKKSHLKHRFELEGHASTTVCQQKTLLTSSSNFELPTSACCQKPLGLVVVTLVSWNGRCRQLLWLHSSQWKVIHLYLQAILILLKAHVDHWILRFMANWAYDMLDLSPSQVTLESIQLQQAYASSQTQDC